MQVREILVTTAEYQESAQNWQRKLSELYGFNLQIRTLASECKQDYCLLVNEQGLSLQMSSDKKMGGLIVDFCHGAVAYRRHHGGGTGQAVAKAIGLKQTAKLGRPLRVLDATAGMGTDSFIFASLGCDVTLIERNPIVASLLEDGLTRALEHPDVKAVAERMRLVNGSSLKWMVSEAALDHKPTCENEKPFDVVYLDPMFPHSGKSAQVKKAMQYFRSIVGADEDADELLNPALQMAEFRVVVKRPRHSPFLDNQKPTLSHEGKANRFDIYVNRSIG